MAALENKPYIVSWNMTKQCNLSCPHCYLDAQIKESEELTTEEAQSVINKLSSFNSPLMLVLSGGEPMLRKDIYAIVEYASQAGFMTVMGTNGTLLTRERLRLLKQSGLMGVGISIDSTSAYKHDMFRGMEGAWLRSMTALSEARQEGIETQLDVTLRDDNCEEIDDLVNFGAWLGAKAVNFFFLVCTGRAMKSSISIKNYDSALKYLAKIAFQEQRLMVRARCAPHFYRIIYDNGFPISEGTYGCLAGRTYMRIDPVGNITPCPYMPFIIGRIQEDSLPELWETNPHLKRLREGTYKGRCGICEYKGFCGGCRARALMESNDFMEQDSLCTYKPNPRNKIRLTEDFHGDMLWDDQARERIKRVPLFMKKVVIRIIESKAKERGLTLITSELLDELKSSRQRLPMNQLKH